MLNAEAAERPFLLYFKQITTGQKIKV